VTREGALYILIIFILSLAALNTGNNLLFLILATMLSIIIISGVVARNALKLISLSLQVPENVFVGEKVSIKISARNMKRLFPSFSIWVDNPETRRASLSGRQALEKLAFWKSGRAKSISRTDRPLLRQAAYFAVIRPGEIRSELVPQTFPQRGPYNLEGLRISTRFPFGLFRRSQRVRTQGRVLVYPSVQDISSYFHLLPFLPGHLEGKRAGPGESLYAIRKYQPGESVRIIDWKASARAGEMMAHEYAREEESKFCLILDTRIRRSPRAEPAEDFEKAVSLAASLAVHFHDEGSELEFVTPVEHISRGIGVDHLYSILRSLALVNCREAPADDPGDLRSDLSGILDSRALRQIFSEKVFKIIITSKPRGSFPSSVWRSSHVVYFDEL
jgi:uncharacterized protein (DUF58 family)